MTLRDGCVEACPGCRYRGLPPEESDRRKQSWAASCLADHAPALLPIRAPRERWGYRRKALLHARFEEGEWRFGLLRRRGRVARLIPIPDCPLHDPALNARLMDLRSLVPAALPLVYVQASGAFLTLVLKCPPREEWRSWARTLEAPLREAGLESLQLNWNPAAGRRALSSRHQEVVFGPTLASDQGLAYGPQSFRQQIPEVETAALDLAEEFLAKEGLAKAVDLYCGVGASLARWRSRGWQAAGVELVGEACVAAERNAPGAHIFKGKVEQRLPQLDPFVRESPFVLYTNPPRDGHAEEVNQWIQSRSPERIAYLSCNPKSLSRDLNMISAQYEVERIQPFDFFPQTDHVECLALLRRRRSPILES